MIEKEKYLRLAADFDNYRKRMESELADMAKFGSRLVITDILDVLDRLEHAIAHIPQDTHPEWLKGLQQVQRQFEAVIQKAGAKRIITDGVFDPTTMEAVQMVEGPGESHKVQSEVRAGYTMHDRVIRPARVIVYK